VTALSVLRGLGLPLLVGVLSFALALLAMLPGLGFWDTAEFQTVGPLLGTAHPGGFPFYVVLGWLASVVLQPFGEPAFRMNLLAGLCLAAAAGITTDLVRTLTRSTWIGVAAGVGLVLTPEAWRIGTHAEAHALHLVFVALILRLSIGWEIASTDDQHVPGRAARWLLALSFAFGLSMGNHTLTLLLGLPIALYVRAVDPQVFRDRRFVATCAAVIAATMAVEFLELPLRAGPFRAPLVYGRPETWDGFWYVVLSEQFRGNLISPLVDLVGTVSALVDRTLVQFGPWAPLLPLAFWATVMSRPRYAFLTGTAALFTCLFAASYENAEIGRYYLGPILMAWTWLAVLAKTAAEVVAAFVAPSPRRAVGLAQIEARRFAARGVPVTIAAAILLAPALAAAPFRYEAVNETGNDAAQRWVDAAFARMPTGAVIVSWWSYSTPVWYAQLIDGRRPDIVVIDDRTRLDQDLGDITDVIDAHLGRDPVYVIRDDPAEAALLESRYQLEFLDGVDARSLTRVIGHRSPGS
jgi:hypothetical protein